jgi:hypothetical protein
MTLKADILARFSGEPSQRPLYVPDLTLWYDWHHNRGTLPQRWRDYSLPQIARALGVPVWLVARPWRIETPGITTATTQEGKERVLRSETPAGTLVARWTLGPEGEWWQTEYPVKTREDLPAVRQLVKARSYVLDTAELARQEAMVGEDGVLAIEIPRRPYSDMLHEFLGWGEGLLLVSEPAVGEIITGLELKLQDLVQEVASLPGQLILSPDNLDGQFISPTVFQAYLADSYRLSADVLDAQDKRLVVHAGGPIQHLLALLAAMGVDGVEGVAGPPQGDATLAEARQLAGPELTLWGGIPQDFLLEAREEDEFQAAVRQAVQEAAGDSRMILGVADRVPVGAELNRLKAMPDLIQGYLKKA